MQIAPKTRKIDELMDQASEALVATRYFEAERLADKALTMARHTQDWDRMARIIMPLQEARRQRYQRALDVGKVTVVEETITESMTIKPGCYLVQPPHVAADARRMRLTALRNEVFAAILCREPTTREGLMPVVAISPGSTVRAKVRPAKNMNKPTIEWFADTMEQLGDWAVETIDPGLDLDKRIDLAMYRLDAIPEHEGLHQVLEKFCREAQHNPPRKDRTFAALERTPEDDELDA